MNVKNRDVKWCPICEKNFEHMIIEIANHNYPELSSLVTSSLNYKLRSFPENIMKLTKIFRGLLIEFRSQNFHQLQIPKDLLDVCCLINTERTIQYNLIVQSYPNIYAYITNCASCDKCFAKKINIETRNSVYTNSQYINSHIINTLYEIISFDPSIIDYMRENHPKEFMNIKETLVYIKETELEILNSNWKGVCEIYKKLFGIPIYLDGAVSKEHYDKFHSGYITDVIAGHPMASNGWMREAMDEMEEMGVFS